MCAVECQHGLVIRMMAVYNMPEGEVGAKMSLGVARRTADRIHPTRRARSET